MPEDVVRTVTSASGTHRALVVRMTTGAFRVEVQRWTSACDTGYGIAPACWVKEDAGRTYADTADRAAELAAEALRAFGG